MNYIGKFISNFKEFYNDINSATLTGAIDVIVVKQPDGSYLCSPFHVRFGKLGVLHSKEKVVDIEVNGEPIDLHMKLGESGEAFFVEEVEDESVPSHLATSPIPSTPDIAAELERMKMESSDEGRPLEAVVEVGEEVHAEAENLAEIHPLFKPDCALEIIVQEETVDGSEGQEMSGAGEPVADHVCRCASPCQEEHVTVINENGRTIVDLSCLKSPEPVHADDSSSPSPHDRLLDEAKDEVTIAVQTEVSFPTDSLELSKDGGHSGASEGADVSSLRSGSLDHYTDDCRQRKRRRKKLSLKKRPRSRDPELNDLQMPSGGESRKDPGGFRHPSDRQPVLDDPEDIFQMDDDYGLDSFSTSSPLSRSLTVPLTSSMEKDVLDETWSHKRLSATFPGSLHPFSDGDVTPISSPQCSRPPSPKSDTEYEIQKHDATSQTEPEVSWEWGELPSISRRSFDERSRLMKLKSQERAIDIVSSDDEEVSSKAQKAEDEKRSMLSGMLSFMRSTKKLRHKPESGGVYLADINLEELDPEVAALYFPKFKLRRSEDPRRRGMQIKDEDAESGNGPSLPHSPHSVEYTLGVTQGLDSDSDERHAIFDYCSKHYTDLAMSLCGGMENPSCEVPTEQFLHSLVTYDDFCENPSILQNPDLVIRMSGKFYSWSAVAPLLMSLAMYQRPLPEKTMQQIIDHHMPKKKKKTYSSWWSWRRSPPSIQEQKPSELPKAPSEEKPLLDQSRQNDSSPEAKSEEPAEAQSQNTSPPSSEPASTNGTPKRMVQSERVEALQEESYNSTSSETEEVAPPPPGVERRLSKEKRLYYSEKYKKTLRLSSEQITSLNLKEGSNEVVFSVTTAYQGTTRCKCHVYLWRFDDRVVVSDIDGTITKSDVLGHLLPIIGKDWAQSGVARLFTMIKSNGFQFLYLSARAIGQAHITREYLRSVRQGDICLPDGPLLLSPTSLMNALHREVIEKKPEEFKISCLRDIQAVFSRNEADSPFYAGFGNKINDTWAYRAVGIPQSRIFTINYRGELKLELMHTFQSSYTRLGDVVDHLFPPLQRLPVASGKLIPTFPVPEKYSSFTYWREPILTVPDDDMLIKEAEPKK